MISARQMSHQLDGLRFSSGLRWLFTMRYLLTMGKAREEAELARKGWCVAQAGGARAVEEERDEEEAEEEEEEEEEAEADGADDAATAADPRPRRARTSSQSMPSSSDGRLCTQKRGHSFREACSSCV